MVSNIAIVPEAVLFASPGTKAEALAELSRLFARTYQLDGAALLDAFEEREALGSTGFGKGVAIPHCRNAAVNRPTAAILKLETPCDFAAADAQPVSLIFGLVSPENCGATHLHALAAISRLLREEAKLQSLQTAPDSEAVFALLTNQFLRDAA